MPRRGGRAGRGGEGREGEGREGRGEVRRGEGARWVETHGGIEMMERSGEEPRVEVVVPQHQVGPVVQVPANISDHYCCSKVCNVATRCSILQRGVLCCIGTNQAHVV